MAADDPVSALRALNESDDRLRSPARWFTKQFIEIVKLFATPGMAIGASAVSTIFDWLDRQPQENLSEPVDTLADEMKYRGAQIQELIEQSAEHKAFVGEHLPGLVVDAMRRSERIRDKHRIRRFARILVHSVEVGKRDLADYTEELLRIAAELSDQDVVVLREIVSVQRSRITKCLGRVTPYEAYSHSAQIRGSLQQKALIQGEIDSICAKLESFGLVMLTERNVNVIAEDPVPIALLQRGADFVDYIASADTNAQN